MPKEDNINLPLIKKSQRNQSVLCGMLFACTVALWGVFDRSIINLSEVIGIGIIFGGLYVAAWFSRLAIWRIMTGVFGAVAIGLWWWYNRKQFPNGDSGLLIAMSGLAAGFLTMYAVFYRFLRQKHTEYNAQQDGTSNGG